MVNSDTGHAAHCATQRLAYAYSNHLYQAASLVDLRINVNAACKHVHLHEIRFSTLKSTHPSSTLNLCNLFPIARRAAKSVTTLTRS